MKKAKQDFQNIILVALIVILVLSFAYWRMQAPAAGTNDDALTGQAVLLENTSGLSSEDDSTEVDDSLTIQKEIVPITPQEEIDAELFEAEQVVPREEPTSFSNEVPILQVMEGEVVSFPNLRVDDLDGDDLTFLFSAPIGNDGTWQTREGDAGTYNVSITASDGISDATEHVLVVVEALNQAPVIVTEKTIAVDEGELLTLTPVITDAEGDEIKISYSGWMTSNEKQIGFNESGRHVVTIRASDGQSVTTETVTIVVGNVNRKPIFRQII